MALAQLVEGKQHGSHFRDARCFHGQPIIVNAEDNITILFDSLAETFLNPNLKMRGLYLSDPKRHGRIM